MVYYNSNITFPNYAFEGMQSEGAKMIYPLKFKPLYKDYVWGGRNLGLLGKLLPPKGVVAESWEVACHKNGSSIAANGEYEGTPLPELIKLLGRRLVGDSLPQRDMEKFPLLLKFIDAEGNLSVQVHPDDAFANAYENEEYGKNEMWYIISARPSAKIVYDVLPGTTRDGLARAIKEGSIVDCLKTVYVSPGDIINIPAGVIHSVGKGIILAEIQQSSDTTYRIYDYGRTGRELHIEKALQVIRFAGTGIREKYTGLDVTISDCCKRKIAAANEHFCTEIYSVDGQVREIADGSKFYIYMFISGEGTIIWGNKELPVKSGESVLMPAVLGEYALKGRFRALKVYKPDLQADIIRPLRAAGIADDVMISEIAGLKISN